MQHLKEALLRYTQREIKEVEGKLSHWAQAASEKQRKRAARIITDTVHMEHVNLETEFKAFKEYIEALDPFLLASLFRAFLHHQPLDIATNECYDNEFDEESDVNIIDIFTGFVRSPEYKQLDFDKLSA